MQWTSLLLEIILQPNLVKQNLLCIIYLAEPTNFRIHNSVHILSSAFSHDIILAMIINFLQLKLQRGKS